MSNPPFESIDALQRFLSQSSEERFQSTLTQFSLPELAQSFSLLQAQPGLEAKSKLEKLFRFIDSPATLTAMGAHFSLPSFLSFLEFLTQHSDDQHRLSLVLVGVDPLLFSQALPRMGGRSLDMLKQEGLLEPLQYQLTQFVHEGESLIGKIEYIIAQFQEQLVSIKGEELTQEVLESLTDPIDELRKGLLNYLEKAVVALILVWHTDRVDLIEKLSFIREAVQHQLTQLIGHPCSDRAPATGVYSFAEHIFSSIFDSSLKNDDPSTDGMTRLSIWHLKDYWEIGLLPSIRDVEELELNPQKFSETERRKHHQRLMSLVQKQLEHLGIGTVENLKKAHLFSRSLLKAYLERHRHLLIEFD